jgi:hypothetical protein
MRRKPVAQGLMEKFREKQEVELIFEPDYAHADVAIRSHDAFAALIEVDETGEYDVAYCLALCTLLRKETPQCKLLVMCPEQNKDSIDQVVKAKQKGCIDDFVFYDSTIPYLTSKFLSL